MIHFRFPLIARLIVSVVVTIYAAAEIVINKENSGAAFTFALIVFGVLLLTTANKILSSRFLSRREKFHWILIIICGGYLGILLYLLMGEKESNKQIQNIH